MNKYPVFAKRKTTNLNKLWDFKFLEHTEFNDFEPACVEFDDRLPVPSAFDAFPAYSGKRGLGVYRCYLDIPSNTDALLKFGAVGMYCRIYIDGCIAGEHYSAYTAFDCRVPKSENVRREVIVVAGNRFDYKINPLQEIFFDFYAYGGIFREVELHLLPKGELIDWVGVDTIDYKNRRLKVAIKASGIQNLTVGVDGKFQFNLNNIDFSKGKHEFEFELKDGKLWSQESPALHVLEVDNGTDSITVRFGIRVVEASKGKILLNGKPVKLLGVCRHEAHPQYGPALPYQQLVADLQIIRDMGCNFIRGTHYAQDPRFLQLCDEMGFLVFEESMGWGQSVKHFTDVNFVEAQLRQCSEMISASYNSPSVIIRGFLNEGESDNEGSREFYEAMVKLIRKEAPRCLVTSASNKALEDRFLELYDVICLNLYPGWYSEKAGKENPLDEIVPAINKCISEIHKSGLNDKPLIISEIGAGAIYGWRDPVCAHWSEEYQEKYLEIVCNEVVKKDIEEITGIALWQFCDCRTYRGAGALMRPRTFNNKGILDEYRRPKLAYASVKKIFQEYLKYRTDECTDTSELENSKMLLKKRHRSLRSGKNRFTKTFL
jgi:beta-glucuronidase